MLMEIEQKENLKPAESPISNTVDMNPEFEVQCINHKKLPFNWTDLDRIKLKECYMCAEGVFICENCFEVCHRDHCEEERVKEKVIMEKNFECGCAKNDHYRDKNELNFGDQHDKKILKCVNYELYRMAGSKFYYKDEMGNIKCYFCLFNHKSESEIENIKKYEFELNNEIENLKCNCHNHEVLYKGTIKADPERVNFDKLLGIIFNNETLYNEYFANLDKDMEDIKNSKDFSLNNLKTMMSKNCHKHFSQISYLHNSKFVKTKKLSSHLNSPKYFYTLQKSGEKSTDFLFDIKLANKFFELNEVNFDMTFILGYEHYLSFLLDFVYLPKFHITQTNLMRFSFENSSSIHRKLLNKKIEREFELKKMDLIEFKNLMNNIYSTIKLYLGNEFRSFIENILLIYFRWVEFALSFDLNEEDITNFINNFIFLSYHMHHRKNETEKEILSDSTIKIYHKLLLNLCYKYNDYNFFISLKTKDTFFFEKQIKTVFSNSDFKDSDFPILAINDKCEYFNEFMDMLIIKKDKFIEVLDSAIESNQNIFIEELFIIMTDSDYDMKLHFEDTPELFNKFYWIKYLELKTKYFNQVGKRIQAKELVNTFVKSVIINKKNEEFDTDHFLNEVIDLFKKCLKDLEEALNLATKRAKFIKQIFLFKNDYFEMIFDILKIIKNSVYIVNQKKLVMKSNLVTIVYKMLAKLVEENSFIITQMFTKKVIKLLYSLEDDSLFLSFYSGLFDTLHYQNFKLDSKHFINILELLIYKEKNENHINDDENADLLNLNDNPIIEELSLDKKSNFLLDLERFNNLQNIFDLISNMLLTTSKNFEKEINYKCKNLIKYYLTKSKLLEEIFGYFDNILNGIKEKNLEFKSYEDNIKNTIKSFFKLINTFSTDFFYLFQMDLNIETIERFLKCYKILDPDLRIELTYVCLKFYYRCSSEIYKSQIFYKSVQSISNEKNILPQSIIDNVYLCNQLANDDNIMIQNLMKFKIIHKSFEREYFKYPKNFLDYFVKIALIPTKEILQHIVYFNNKVDNETKFKVYQIICLFFENFRYLLNVFDNSKLVTEDFTKIFQKFFANNTYEDDYVLYFNKIFSDLDKIIKKMDNLDEKNFNLLNTEKLIEDFKKFTSYFSDKIYEINKGNDKKETKEFYELIKKTLRNYKNEKSLFRENIVYEFINKDDILKKGEGFVNALVMKFSESLKVNNYLFKKNIVKENIDLNIKKEIINNDEVNNDVVNNDEIKNDVVNNDEIKNDEVNNDEVNNNEVNNNEVKDDKINDDGQEIYHKSNTKSNLKEIRLTRKTQVLDCPDLEDFNPDTFFYLKLINQLMSANHSLFFGAFNQYDILKKFITKTFNSDFSIYLQMFQMEFNSYTPNSENHFLEFFKNSVKFFQTLSVTENGSFLYLLAKFKIILNDEVLLTVEELICSFFCFIINNLQFYVEKKKWVKNLNENLENKQSFLEPIMDVMFGFCQDLIKFSPISLFSKQVEIEKSKETVNKQQVEGKDKDKGKSKRSRDDTYIEYFTTFLDKSKMIFMEIQKSEDYNKYFKNFVKFLETFCTSFSNKNVEVIKSAEILDSIFYCYKHLYLVYTNKELTAQYYLDSHVELLYVIKTDSKVFENYYFDIISKLYLLLLGNSENDKLLNNMEIYSKHNFYNDNLDLQSQQNQSIILQREVYLFLNQLLTRVELKYEDSIEKENNVKIIWGHIFKDVVDDVHFNKMKGREITSKQKKEKKSKNQVVVDNFIIHPDGLFADKEKDLNDFLEIAPYDNFGQKHSFLLEYFNYFSTMIFLRKCLMDDKILFRFFKLVMKINIKFVEYFSLFMILLTNFIMLISLNSNDFDDSVIDPLHDYTFYVSLIHLVVLFGILSCTITLEVLKFFIYFDIIKGSFDKMKYFEMFFNKSVVYLTIIFFIGFIAILSPFLNFFYCLQLFYICLFVDTMQTVFLSIKLKYKEFTAAALLILIMVLFFAIVSHMFFLEEFYNEDLGQNLCENLSDCFFTLINSGIRSGAGLGFSIISYKNPNYISEFLFEWLFYFLIILVMLNIINGIIVDTFQSLREENNKKSLIKNEICYICSLDRSKFETNGIDFKNHQLKEHNIINYLQYIYFIKNVDTKMLKLSTLAVKNKVDNNLTSFFPKGVAASLQR